MGAEVVLALDLGGTQVRAAGVLPGGAVAAVRRLHTPSEDGSEAIVSACIAALREVRDDLATRADLAPAIGIGICAPGPVDPGTGTVLDPPNLGPTFHDVPLAARISNALGLPVVLDRDTQVAALGEGRFGAAAGCDDFVYMTVSTGVGGAIVTGGRLLRGPDGTAGELGHLVIDVHGPLCGCGMRGHLEAIASGSGIASRAREAAARGESELLRGTRANPRCVLRRPRRGRCGGCRRPSRHPDHGERPRRIRVRVRQPHRRVQPVAHRRRRERGRRPGRPSARPGSSRRRARRLPPAGSAGGDRPCCARRRRWPGRSAGALRGADGVTRP
jgi:predicted NBD/HSP70 family sugar kinase